MKNLFLSLVLLLNVNGFTQSHNDTLKKWYEANKLAVEKEFVRLIDSARSSLLLEKHVIYRSVDGITQKELRSIVKKETSEGNFCQVIKKSKSHKIFYILITKNFHVVKMEYDSLLSLATEHHAKYLLNVGEKHVEHEEYEKFSSNFLILYDVKDRVKYYSKGRTCIGECLTTFKTNIGLQFVLPEELNGITVENFAYYYFNIFKDSKPHWKILMMKHDVDYMGCSLEIDFSKSFISFVAITGNNINNNYDDLNVEGLTLK